MKQLRRIFKHIITTLSVCVVLLGVYPTPVYAQNAGFTECNFSATQSSEGSAAVSRCIQQILQFIFIIALFVIAIRIATLALNNYNPVQSGNADKQAITLVWEVTLGLILIGGPVLFLNTVNPALLRLNFLDTSDLASPDSGSNGSSGNSTSGSNTGSGSSSNGSNSKSITDPKNPSKTVTADDAKKAAQTVGSNGSTTYTVLDSFTPFTSLTANAQEGELTLQEAEEILETVFNTEEVCTSPFIPQDQLDNCIDFESDFAQIIADIRPNAARSIKELNDTNKMYSGTLFSPSDIQILPVTLDSSPTLTKNCAVHYAVIDVNIALLQNETLIGIELCDGDISNQAFFENSEDGSIQPRVNQTIPAREVVISEGKVITIID